MNRTGEDTRANKASAVQAFLEAFDNDPIAAAGALRDHVAQQRLSKADTRREVSNSPVLLTAKDISKTYKIGKQKLDVLKNVSLDIHEGEFVAITGASGSGKSTLLQLMGGLDRPSSGEVWFGSENLATLSDRKLSDFRLRTVGFVFQFFYLQPFLRLENNLEVPGMFMRSPIKERRKRLTELAEQVGLGDRLKHFPRELSGGQMQRAAIARALVNQPKILLADEPTGNLDSRNGAAIIELFQTIRRDLGTAVVIVTHDASIARLADREIRMKDGEIL